MLVQGIVGTVETLVQGIVGTVVTLVQGIVGTRLVVSTSALTARVDSGSIGDVESLAQAERPAASTRRAAPRERKRIVVIINVLKRV